MKTNMDDLLVSVCHMLRNPGCYGYLATETMSLSLEILYQRIKKADCCSVFHQDISQEEYEHYLEKLFTELDLSKIIYEIKNDYENEEGDKNDNNN